MSVADPDAGDIGDQIAFAGSGHAFIPFAMRSASGFQHLRAPLPARLRESLPKAGSRLIRHTRPAFC